MSKRILSLLIAAACLGSTAQADDPTPASMLGTEAGQVREDNSLKMKLVWCPPGAFVMGRGERSHAPTVLASGNWLGKYEVTQSEWKQVMKTEPWWGQTKAGDDLPVTVVDWDEAMAFCATMTRLERLAGRLPDGWEYTLPTEAQWERACRAGTYTTFSFGDDESQLDEYAWFAKNARDGGEPWVHAVGTKKPNPWGLHDMHGNAREWCRDAFAELPGGTDPLGKPGPKLAMNRINRGGSINEDASRCRSTVRSGNSPSNRGAELGFRVALTLVRPAADNPAK